MYVILQALHTKETYQLLLNYICCLTLFLPWLMNPTNEHFFAYLFLACISNYLELFNDVNHVIRAWEHTFAVFSLEEYNENNFWNLKTPIRLWVSLHTLTIMRSCLTIKNDSLFPTMSYNNLIRYINSYCP